MKRNVMVLVFLVACSVVLLSSSAFAYTVVRGDNLWKIAGKQYGKNLVSRALCNGIAKANGIKNPDVIYPGQDIKFPELAMLKKISSKKVAVVGKYVSSSSVQPKTDVVDARNESTEDKIAISLSEPVVISSEKKVVTEILVDKPSKIEDVSNKVSMEIIPMIPIEVQPVGAHDDVDVQNKPPPENKIIDEKLEEIVIIYAEKTAQQHSKSVEVVEPVKKIETEPMELKDQVAEKPPTEKVAEVNSLNQEIYSIGKTEPVQLKTSGSGTESNDGYEYDASVSPFYGCPDILSECRGGKADLNVYKKKKNLGFNLQAAGAYGTVLEDEYVWYKISSGGGLNYRRYFGDSTYLAVKYSLLIQTFKSSRYGFDNKQLELMSLKSIKLLYEQNAKLRLGVEAFWTMPVALLSFSTNMPGGERAKQSRGQVDLIAEWQINKSLESRLKISPLVYQAENNLLGAMTVAELKYKNLVFFGGVIFYPYDNIPNTLTQHGVTSGKLTNAIFGIRGEFGKINPFSREK